MDKTESVDKFAYLGSTHSRAVHIGDEVTARVAKARVAFGILLSGSEMESSSTLTRLWYYQPSCMHVHLDSIPTSFKEIYTFPCKLFEKAVKNQVARQDSRHRGPEESNEAKHASRLKASTAKIKWSCYKNS